MKLVKINLSKMKLPLSPQLRSCRFSFNPKSFSYYNCKQKKKVSYLQNQFPHPASPPQSTTGMVLMQFIFCLFCFLDQDTSFQGCDQRNSLTLSCTSTWLHVFTQTGVPRTKVRLPKHVKAFC